MIVLFRVIRGVLLSIGVLIVVFVGVGVYLAGQEEAKRPVTPEATAAPVPRPTSASSVSAKPNYNTVSEMRRKAIGAATAGEPAQKGVSPLPREDQRARAPPEVENAKWQRGKYDQLTITGVVHNFSGRKYAYAQVEINLFDKEGNQVGSTMANINNLEAGGTWKFTAPIFDDANVHTFRVMHVNGF